MPKSEAIDPTIINASGLNLAVVRGEVSSPPEVRVLPSEAVLVQLQVTTRLESETLSTPIAVWNPPAWVEELEPGTEIVVVGRIRRRFFRAAGATASRVELEADVVARATDRRRVRAALRKVNAALEPLEA
ncbi:MAG: single-strand DNA-binding protein [Actinomycetota bacterium]|nr:single-strand DNA-binding protein [Actinomycetota bacterium]